MPNRILKESICRSDDIDRLSWFEEVLFYRLIVVCDDYGRFDARARIIKGTCFPLKDVTDKNIENAIHKLSTVGLVRVYMAQGRPYLQLVAWAEHQRVRTQKSKYPAPEEDSDSLLSIDSRCPQIAVNCPPESESEIESESKSESESESEGLIVSDETICQTDVRRILSAWNELAEYGIPQVSRLDAGSKRGQALKARMKQYGVDKVLKAIENIKHSAFLQGKKKDFVISFDWFVKPNNFPKVLEGNYADRGDDRHRTPDLENERQAYLDEWSRV